MLVEGGTVFIQPHARKRLKCRRGVMEKTVRFRAAVWTGYEQRPSLLSFCFYVTVE